MYVFHQSLFHVQDATPGFLAEYAGLNSEFCNSQTGCCTKANEPNLANYLPVEYRIRYRFLPFLRALERIKVQVA